MPNRCYFITMALDLIFWPRCLFTQILEYHIFTKIIIFHNPLNIYEGCEISCGTVVIFQKSRNLSLLTNNNFYCASLAT